MVTVKLDVLSDPICPWCYIGKANLDKALAELGEHPFVIEWHPFQLNPDMPIDGMDRRAYLEGKFGGKDGAVRAYAPVVDHAEKAGLTINLDKIARTPNTLNAHRMIHWAGVEGKQTGVVDALFQAYFVDGKDIGSIDTLVEIGTSVGLEADVIRKLLEGENDLEDIRQRDAHSRKMGVSSVPTFIIANQHAVPGAQPPELWKQVIADITEQLQQAESE
ncbi:thioredoxin domain-containing protein [Epibacterium sp. SM1979]|uniref:Thioredoxin domain-containing protein n=1 Tax=Tritonibacter litoralis TaxID=2662264 RepID=A0A843YBC1_9RHOB|nr:DsbA family oxidoreductase [Tritonibacter litoralis]MQQ07178.1 thioredoxin domain-containing protein [Tritonibacter litoralis]